MALIQLASLLVSGTAADSGGWVLVLLLFVSGVWGRAFHHGSTLLLMPRTRVLLGTVESHAPECDAEAP